MTFVLRPELDAPTPATWLAEHLHARFDRYAGHLGSEDLDVCTLEEVLADGAALIRAAHGRLVANGTPPPAASTYLADWFGGIVALGIGFGLAAAGAGFVIDGEADPGAILYHFHPEGWPCRLELRARALVTTDHPWAADGVAHRDVVRDVDEVVQRTVDGLVNAVSPIISACRSLASVGTVGLWNEVADSFGAALTYQDLVDPTPSMAEILTAALTAPGTPWRARPSLRFVESDLLGTVHLTQKGGCCLAYTAEQEPPDPDEPDEGTDDDPAAAAFARRFPAPSDGPHYCTNCSFRDPGDCDRRQIYWRELLSNR